MPRTSVTLALQQIAAAAIAVGVAISASHAVVAQDAFKNDAGKHEAFENWPSKPVRVIINFGVGGATDHTMRAFGERVAKRLGQPIVIENRGGASGSVIPRRTNLLATRPSCCATVLLAPATRLR